MHFPTRLKFEVTDLKTTSTVIEINSKLTISSYRKPQLNFNKPQFGKSDLKKKKYIEKTSGISLKNLNLRSETSGKPQFEIRELRIATTLIKIFHTNHNYFEKHRAFLDKTTI